MANSITVAQIRTLKRMTQNFPSNAEVKLAHRYASGNLLLYLPQLTMDIFPNGNWRIRSPRTGETLTEGKYETDPKIAI